MPYVNLEIDGIPVTVPRETTILKAAETVGIEIPTLCYLKDLAPDGSCRFCVVDVDGGRKKGLLTACSEHCSEGMKVETMSQDVKDARKFILEMLLSNHTMKCFSCTRNGNCKLQDYSKEYGAASGAVKGKKIKREIDTSNPFLDFDPELCIMCRKCERICTSLHGRRTISINKRGFDTRMSMIYDKPWGESICESCGNCVEYCPVGALSRKDSKGAYRPWEVKYVRTTCPHCGTGCQFDLIVKKNKVVGAKAFDGPSNNGLLCVKGRFGSYNFVHSEDRLKYPLIKKNGVFERASWKEALELIVSKFSDIKKNYGPDSIAGFSCSRATNEDNYIFQKLMRAVIGTNNVDNCARLCHSASVHGLAMTLGSGAMTNPIKDITGSPEVILLVGSNTTEAHPVVGSHIRAAVERGAKLIVVDPRKIDLVDRAHIHLQIKPGTNVAFANGLMNVIIKHNLADLEYIQERTEGYEKLKEIVKEYTPEKVGEICNIDPKKLEEAAILYAKAGKAPVIYCLGVTEHSTGTEGVMSMSNIAMLVGKIGKEGCGVNPLRGQNNVQGACDMGCLPYDLPGYQKVENPEIISKFENAWGVKLSTNRGLMSTQVLPAAIDGEVKGLYIFGEDPVVTDPDTSHVKKALSSLDFLVVQELFMTETAQMADVVLPGKSYAEKEGTFTNTERRVQRVRKAVNVQGEMKDDWKIFTEIMNLMGYEKKYSNSSEIMDEIAALVPSFGGISHKRLDEEVTGIQWPCPDSDHPGTPILHMEKFTRGLGWFYPAEYKEPKELPDKDFPLLLVTGRMLYHYNTRSMTGRTDGLNEVCDKSYIEINTKDAFDLSIKNGEKVRVYSRRGQIETIARVGEVVSPGEVFMTFHFPDGNVNKVTNSATDEIARIPEYKVCAVKLEKI